MEKYAHKAGLYRGTVALLGVGAPGSGKTTFLRLLARELGSTYHYLCADDFRELLTDDAADQSVNAEAWQMLYEAAEMWLERGESVVIDATHARVRERRAAVKRYRNAGAATVVAVVLKTDVVVAMERNQGRGRVVPKKAIRHMAAMLAKDPASRSDGFDDIIEVET